MRARLIRALTLVAAALPAHVAAEGLVDAATERKIDALLARMTLQEKVGQLNQYTSAFEATGPVPDAGRAREVYEQVRSGQVGSVLNVTGVEATRRLQQLAVEKSRLRIPLLFGLDVVHGYRTIFPIPLGEAASWDLEAIERSARVAAEERRTRTMAPGTPGRRGHRTREATDDRLLS